MQEYNISIEFCALLRIVTQWYLEAIKDEKGREFWKANFHDKVFPTNNNIFYIDFQMNSLFKTFLSMNLLFL
jgi:hypothetical protein